MDSATGEVVAEASAVTMVNGKLVPDSLGLPPVRKRQLSPAQVRAMHMRRKDECLYDRIDAMNLGYETFSYEDLCERLGISR
jgi:hypothetical protein